MPAVGLLILAAGGSRRLGRPKQLLRDAQGRSLIRRAAETALSSCCRPVTAVLGASADAVRDEIIDLPLTTVANPDWELGLASSLRAGLTALTADTPLDAVVIMLCDQPLVTSALLDALVSMYQESGSEIVACEYDGVRGVPALFSRAVFEALGRLDGDEGAARVIKSYQGTVAGLPFPGGRFDVDTAADSEALLGSRSS